MMPSLFTGATRRMGLLFTRRDCGGSPSFGEKIRKRLTVLDMLNLRHLRRHIVWLYEFGDVWVRDTNLTVIDD